MEWDGICYVCTYICLYLYAYCFCVRTEVAASSFSRFELPEVMKVAELKDDLRVSELFHGPTLAFKDLGLGVVACLLQVKQQRKSAGFVFQEMMLTPYSKNEHA